MNVVGKESLDLSPHLKAYTNAKGLKLLEKATKMDELSAQVRELLAKDKRRDEQDQVRDSKIGQLERQVEELKRGEERISDLRKRQLLDWHLSYSSADETRDGTKQRNLGHRAAHGGYFERDLKVLIYPRWEFARTAWCWNYRIEWETALKTLESENWELIALLDRRVDLYLWQFRSPDNTPKEGVQDLEDKITTHINNLLLDEKTADEIGRIYSGESEEEKKWREDVQSDYINLANKHVL